MKTLDELGISLLPWTFDEKAQAVRCGGATVEAIADDEWIADARLIAAAPELYEALAAMLHCAELNRPYLDMSHMDIAMDMARKALAKAGGEKEEEAK